MSYSATVFQVMIASPGDVKEERSIATQEIQKWNDANAFARKILLSPLKWETHSTPLLGTSAQQTINEQVLDPADILIGIFGSRLGTPTQNFDSGTVEEIRRHLAAGKVTKVYFSSAPIERSQFNADQYQALEKFQDECRGLGLYAVYPNLEQFREDFRHHLNLELNRGKYAVLASTAPRVDALERALAEVQLRMRGREISPAQVATLLSASEGKPKGTVEISYLYGDPEAARFATNVADALRTAGWTAEFSIRRAIGGMDSGLGLFVSSQAPIKHTAVAEEVGLIPSDSPVYHARVLKDAFARAGIVIDNSYLKSGPPVPRDHVSLSIGQKPL